MLLVPVARQAENKSQGQGARLGTVKGTGSGVAGVWLQISGLEAKIWAGPMRVWLCAEATGGSVQGRHTWNWAQMAHSGSSGKSGLAR